MESEAHPGGRSRWLRTWLILAILAGRAGAAGSEAVQVDGNRVSLRGPNVQVVFEGGAVTSIRGIAGGTEFLGGAPAPQALELFYFNDEAVGQDKHQTVAVTRLSPLAARVVIEGDNTRRALLLCVDPDSGDVLVSPDGLSFRRGVRSVGWKLAFHTEAELFLPVVNGLRVKTAQVRPSDGRFGYPFEWNAPLVIATRGGESMMIHTEDESDQFKALRLKRLKDHTELGIENESPGPWWDNRTAGGVTWRINAYRGGWKTPATRYRDWMRRTLRLEELARHRPAWVKDISLAFSWADPNEAMLDAIAAVHPPGQTLIHLANWRTEKYDVMYPDFTPREDVLKYLARARKLGFHVMPHFNYFAVYYKHPFFGRVADFQIRSADKNEPMGWHWPPDTNDYTRMGYIHPGLGLWRDTLTDAVMKVADQGSLDSVFLDQTLCTWNTENGLVQGRTTSGGMQLLLEQLNRVAPELVLAGEGLTQVSFQRQCFAQAHIYDGWKGLEAWHPEVYVPLNAFLWGDHCRLFGYYQLTPGSPHFELGIRTYENMGAIPSLITNNPEHLKKPDALTRRVLDRARSWRRIATTMTQPE